MPDIHLHRPLEVFKMCFWARWAHKSGEHLGSGLPLGSGLLKGSGHLASDPGDANSGHLM